jgi:Zn-dependent protease with chaperone function
VKPLLVLVPLALEWVVIASTIAPLWVGSFSQRPRLGIFAWLALFLSVALSTVVALGVSIWAVVDNFVNLEQHRMNLALTLVFSMAPWLLFSMAGIAINLMNIKLEPILLKFRALRSTPLLPSTSLRKFESASVEVLELPAMLAFSTSQPSPRILISRGALHRLSQEQLDAVLWHEYAHLAGRHSAIKRLASLVETLVGYIRASKVMRFEIERLCELAADDFAANKVDRSVLASARALFD